MTHKKTRPTFDDLPNSAFVRQADLVPHPKYPERTTLLQFSGATLWRWVKEGKFPKPIKLGANSTFWQVGDIRSWIQDRLSEVNELAAGRSVGETVAV